MHTKQRRHVLLAQLFGDGDVGDHHALFDQAVRFIARDEFDGPHVFAVENELRFRRVEVESAASAACRRQGAVDLHQRQQSLGQLPEALLAPPERPGISASYA